MESKDITSANRNPEMQSLSHSQSTLSVVRVVEDNLSGTHTHTHTHTLLYFSFAVTFFLLSVQTQ